MPVAAYADAAGIRTKLVVVQPVNAAGIPDPSFKIVQRFASGSCTSSDTLAGASRCFAGHYVLDPCWPDGATTPASVVCSTALWGRRLVLVEHPPGIATSASASRGGFAAVMLVGGLHCTGADGASSTFQGKRINYTCSGGHELLGDAKQSSGLWTITEVHYVRASNKYVVDGTVRIAVVWVPRMIVWQ